MRRKNQESGMEQLCFWKDGFMDKQEVADACLLTGPGRMAEGANAVPAPENAEPPQAKPVSEPVSETVSEPVAEVLESERSTTPKTCAVAQAAPPPEPAQEPAPRGEPERFSLVKCAENIPALKPAVAKAEKAEKRDRRSETSAENGKNGGRKPHTPEVWAMEYLARRYQKDGLYTLRYLSGRWFKYTGRGWREWSETDVRNNVTAFLQKEIVVTHIGNSLVNDMLTNLKSDVLAGLDSEKYSMPCFFPGGEKAVEWLPMQNKVINIAAIADAIGRGEAPPDSAFREHSPSLFVTYGLNYDYDPDATCPMWEKYLSEVQTEAWERGLLQMLAGLLLIPDTSYNVAFFLEGDGGTGKSVFLHILQELLGRENYCSVPLAMLGKRFALAPLTEKLANIVGEMPVEEGFSKIADIENNFKLVTAGEVLNVELKYKDAFKAPAMARMVFATNRVPHFTDRSKGVWDRLRIIPFNQCFRGTPRQNPHLAEEIASSELPGILNWAIRGLAELRKLKTFPESPEGEARKDEIREASDHEKDFLTEYAEEVPAPDKTDWISSAELYEEYCKWCRRNGYPAKGNRNFAMEVKRVFKNAKEDRTRTGNGYIRIWRNIIIKKGL